MAIWSAMRTSGLGFVAPSPGSGLEDNGIRLGAGSWSIEVSRSFFGLKVYRAWLKGSSHAVRMMNMKWKIALASPTAGRKVQILHIDSFNLGGVF